MAHHDPSKTPPPPHNRPAPEIPWLGGKDPPGTGDCDREDRRPTQFSRIRCQRSFATATWATVSDRRQHAFLIRKIRNAQLRCHDDQVGELHIVEQALSCALDAGSLDSS